MGTVIISPWSKLLRNGKESPKNYPWWETVITNLIAKGHEVLQVGVRGEKILNSPHAPILDTPVDGLKNLIKNCGTWASVDNFFPHLCHSVGKRGVVIFGKSDPKIFGYPENVNLLKDDSYLRQNQFLWWEDVEPDPSSLPTDITLPWDLAEQALEAIRSSHDIKELWPKIATFLSISEGEGVKEAFTRQMYEKSCFVHPKVVVEAIEGVLILLDKEKGVPIEEKRSV